MAVIVGSMYDKSFKCKYRTFDCDWSSTYVPKRYLIDHFVLMATQE